MRWIEKDRPFSRPGRTLSRHKLLRGLVEEIVYEDSVAQLYASLLAAAIYDGNPVAKREFEHQMGRVRRERAALASECDENEERLRRKGRQLSGGGNAA